MTQVSKFKLDRKIQDTLLKNLLTVISKLNKEDQAKLFLDDLLTRTEKIVLAKRLAIALMLESGKSYEEIKDLLKVSSSTIGVINNRLNSGSGYKLVINHLQKMESKSKNSWLFDFINSKSSLKSRNRMLSPLR